MRRPLRSWKNLLGKLGLQVVDKPASNSRMRQTQRQLTVESLERRDLMATLYWDTNGATPGLGGVGTWNTTAANWTTDATGSSATQAWNNAAGDDAVFMGTGAAVTIGSGIQASSLKIESSGYTLGSGSLAVNGSGEVNVATGISTTISTQLTGSTELRKTGTGTLTLSGNNTLSGGSKLEAGTVAVNHNNALGSGTITLAGGKLQAGNGARTLSNALVAAAATTSEVVSPSGNNLTLNGNLSGTGTIWKTGGFSVYLGGDNSAFAGTFSHRQSNMYFNAATAASAAATWDITGGNQFGANFATAGTLQFGSLAGTSGAIHGGGGSGAKVWEIGALNTSTSYAGTIAGSTVSLVKKGTGTLTLSGNNTFAGGSTIDAGTLRLTNVAGAGAGTIGIGNGTLSLFRSGATTTYANAITSLSGTTGTLTVDGSGSNAGTGTNTTYATGTLTVDGTLTVSRPTGGNGSTLFSGLLAGNGVLRVANTNGGVTPSTTALGRASFSNTANTFAGEVNVLSGGNFLNMTLSPTYAAVDVAAGGHLTLLGGNTITTVGSLTGSGSITKNITTNTANLTIGAGNVSSTFSGIIGQTALNAAGTVTLTKIGTGTLTLSGANTFTGGSTLEAGALAAANNSALGTGAITLSGGKLQAASAARTLTNALVATAATTSEVVAPTGFNLTLNGNLTGAGTIHKTGANTVLLSGNNSGFTGTFSNRQGNVFLTNANAGSAAAVWDISGGAFLGTNFSGNATVQLGALTGTTGKLSVNAGTTGTKTYEVGARNEDFTYGATIADGTSGGGKAVLKKVGTGTMELTGSISGTGTSEVNNGTLFLGKTSNVNSPLTPTGGDVISAAGTTTVTIGKNYKNSTANPNASLSQALPLTGLTFVFATEIWDAIDKVALLKSLVYGQLGVAAQTPFGSTNIKYDVGLVGTELKVKWEDWTDNDYNDYYNDITIVDEAESKCEPGGCPCACGDKATSDSSTGDAGVPTGSQSSSNKPSALTSLGSSYTLPNISTLSGLASIKATLTLGSAVSQDYYFNPAGMSNGDVVRLDLLVDASGETSGEKEWTINLVFLDGSGGTLLSDSATGRYTLVNRDASAFGAGWWRNDLTQLTFSGDYAAVIYGDGKDNLAFYDNSRLFYSVSADSAARQLTRVGSDFRLADKFGNVELFNSAGHLVSKTTATGQTTTYAYVSGHPELLEIVTAPDGDVTRYTYETYASGTKWRVATMVEHDQSLNNVTTEFTYNGTSDNLLTQTVRTTADMVPVIKTETFAYDPTTNQITDITDSESNTTTIIYDFAGRVTSIERSCGGTTALESFRTLGLVNLAVVGNSPTNLAPLTKSFDPTTIGYAEDERGNPRWFKMNALGQLTWEKDAQGNETTFTYDFDGNMLSMIATDPDGVGALEAVETLMTYDAKGNRLTQTERTAVTHTVLTTQSWTYDATFGAVTRSTDELGRVTKYVIGALGGNINDDGRVLSQTRIVGLDDTTSSETDDVTTTYTYGSVAYSSLVVNGLMTSVTDANGHTTTYEYFDNVAPSAGKLGLLQKIINPDLTFRTYDYDAHGNRTSQTDELGRTATYVYDGEDRLIGRTDADPDGAGSLAAPTWSYEYDTNDNQTKIVDPLGRETIMVYNNRTWLAQRIEEGGVTTSYTYNCVGDLKTMTDALGRVTTYAYNNLNQRISVTMPDPDGAGSLTSPVMSTTYDALGRTKTTTDANGNVTTYGYDQHGHQTTVTMADPDGAGPLAAPVYTSVYDDAGQRLSSIDALGRTTSYGYDDLGRQVVVTMPDPDGTGPLAAPVMTTTYDKVGNVLTRTDALGNVTSYAYDDRDRTISVTMADPDGAGPQSAPVMLTVYDDAGQIISTTDALGRVTTYDYDNLGRRVSVTMPDPDGAGALAAPVMTTIYDVASQVTSTTDALGFVTSYEYDDLGRQTKVIQPDPDGAGSLAAPEWTTVYDDAGQVTSSTDPLGRTTTYEYDDLGRTITVTQPDPDGAGSLTSPVFTTSYDANGNVLTSTDALGNVTSYTYDALNRRTLTTQADPDGAGSLTAPVWETVYDVASQVTASIDPLGRTTTYEYDNLGRQTKVTSPDPDGAGPLTAAFTVTTYDVMGNVLTTEDALSHTTSYEYDNLYRLIATTNPNLEESSFTYDLVGNRLTLTDPNGNATEWEYDDLNRVVLETNELNKTRGYVYDVGGRLTSKVDRLGREVEYVYDNLNRVIEELWDSVSAYTWTYDAAGQMLTGGNAATREYVYSYDALGRVTQIDTNEFGSSSVYDLNMTYDANGNRLTRTHTANTATWSYDFLNRAVDVAATGAVGTYGAAFGYNAAGQITFQENADASVNSGSPFSLSEYAYDGAGRLLEIAHKDASNNPFASYGYTWDASDRITAVDFLDGVYDNEDVDYALDAAGQVTGADRAGSGTDETYDYDTNGNRESVTRDGSTATWGVGTNNQLTSDGTNSYTYDDEGNLTSDGVSTYYWDHRNRMLEVRTGSSGVMFTYDINNLRVGKILDLDGNWDYSDSAELDTQTRYYFDGGRMVREVSADGTVENNYMFGVNGQLIVVEDVAKDVLEFAYNDHLGSVRDVIVVDAGTAVHTEHNAYDSFGRVVERREFNGATWNVVTSESIVSLGYTGEYFEVTIGLQYNWNRWYNASTGRWISEDPIGLNGKDINYTRYVGNSAINFTDHSGLAIDLPEIKTFAIRDKNSVDINNFLIIDKDKLAKKFGDVFRKQSYTLDGIYDWWTTGWNEIATQRPYEKKISVEMEWQFSQEYRTRKTDNGDLVFDHLGKIDVSQVSANPKDQVAYSFSVKEYGRTIEKVGDCNIENYTYVVSVGLNQPGLQWKSTMRQIADKILSPIPVTTPLGSTDLKNQLLKLVPETTLLGFEYQMGAGGFSFAWKISATGNGEYERGPIAWSSYTAKGTILSKKVEVDPTASGKWIGESGTAHKIPPRKDVFPRVGPTTKF